MNKLFLPVCLLVAGSAAALSNIFENLLTHEATREACESLSTEQKQSLDAYFNDFELLSTQAQQALDTMAAQHQDGVAALKQIMRADAFVSQFTLIPVAKTMVPQNMAETTEDDNNEEPRFVS